MKKIGILNGPNLNRLGKRDSKLYGTKTLQELETLLKEKAAEQEVEPLFYQSNHEGALIDKLHGWSDMGINGIIVNFGGYSHTSVALRDAVEEVRCPCIEVHISNVFAREYFRKESMIAPVCAAVISGLGFDGYIAALDYLARK